MFFNIASIVLAVTTFASVVYAVPANGNSLNTNAKRFARGLPPLPPSMMKRGVKRTGTKVAAAKRYQPSNLPPHTYTGKIQVTRADNGNIVGYIRDSLGSSGAYRVTNNINNGVAVSFIAAATGPSTRVEIQDTSNNRATTPFIGGVEPSNLNIGPLSTNFITIAGTSHTAEGAIPQSGSTTLVPTGKVESSFWNFNPSTNRFTAQWINYDSTAPATTIIYDSSGSGKIILSGNPAVYLSTHSDALLVILTLV